MSLAKITVSIEPDENEGTDEGMAQTLALLASLGVMPTRKVIITLECEEEDAASYREDIKQTLRRRPVGIIAKIKTTVEDDVAREKMAAVTPMDRAGWN